MILHKNHLNISLFPRTIMLSSRPVHKLYKPVSPDGSMVLRALWVVVCPVPLHSGRVPLLLLGRSHFYRFIQIFLKFTKIYDKILKIFAQKLTRPELGKGVKVPSKVKDKQL